jgi:hypothetical protein
MRGAIGMKFSAASLPLLVDHFDIFATCLTPAFRFLAGNNSPPTVSWMKDRFETLRQKSRRLRVAIEPKPVVQMTYSALCTWSSPRAELSGTKQ